MMLKLLNKLLCKINRHHYEYKFVPFGDQPFEDDPECCIEGMHIDKCKYCGKEKSHFNF